MKGVKVSGIPEVAAALAEIKARFGPAQLKGPLMDGAIILRDQARVNVPTGPGHWQYKGEAVHLKKAIFAGKGKPDKADVIVGVDLKRAPQGFWLEYGTNPHPIKPRFGKYLMLFGRIFAKSVLHPGQKPKPWFRPAIRSASGRVATAIADGCREILGKPTRMRPSGTGPDQTGWIG